MTVAATEEIVAGLLARRFDLGLISMPVAEDKLTILPLFEEELLGLRPAHAGAAARRSSACSRKSWPMRRFCSIRGAATCG